ncbi:hypothetical protein [Pelagibius marinus]|uniref:hypothetical protein n=1 Tax=Pelagibius marinus TaxID=2762760 RepID=UPI001872B4F2|nr:hypothetical protein [Pelagibius marinus]
MKNTILMLYGDQFRFIGTVGAHLEAFKVHSRHDVVQLDATAVAAMSLDFGRFDCIVLHYSLIVTGARYIGDDVRQKLREYQGPKVLFIQDEMRWVDATSAAIKDLGVTTVFTVVNEDVVRKIYRDPWMDRVRFEQTLTGFVPEELTKLPVPAYQDRPIDVSYRARKLPGWCGAFGQEKWIIGARFAADAEAYGLKCDISTAERDRIYGQKWVEFVANSKAMLGTESGASFVDFSGDIAPAVDQFEAANPNLSFEEVRDRFLEGRDGEIVIHVISPRCFEAAALRTLMIMYEGEYSGALTAGRHYVPLKRDHSNMDEVVAVLRDPDRAGRIIESAYNEVACSGAWTYAAFIHHFDRVVAEECANGRRQPKSALDPGEVTALEQRSGYLAARHRRRLQFAIKMQAVAARVFRFIERMLPGFAGRSFLWIGRRVMRLVKPYLRRILLD